MSSAEDNRKKLMDVAEELFADRGYLQTSVRDIAAGAGVRTPSVYYHFGSKEKLLVALLQSRFDWYLGELEIALAEVSEAFDVFRVVAEFNLAAIAERPTLVRFVFSTIFDMQSIVRDTEILPFEARFQYLVFESLERIAKGVDEDRRIFAATMFFGMMMTATLRFLMDGTQDFTESFAPAIAHRAVDIMNDARPVPPAEVFT